MKNKVEELRSLEADKETGKSRVKHLLFVVSCWLLVVRYPQMDTNEHK